MALTAGFQLPFGVQPLNPLPVDSWSGPYEGADEFSAIAAANTAILPAVRFKSMEARLIINGIAKKYWYRDGIADTDLVEFASGSGTGSGVSADLTNRWQSSYSTVNSTSAFYLLEDFIITCSDESTNLSVNPSIMTFRVPFSMELTTIRASVSVPPVGNAISIDVKQNNATLFSTPLTIDSNEDTSTTAAVPVVLDNSILLDDAKISIAVNQVGSSIAGKGLKLTFKGYRLTSIPSPTQTPTNTSTPTQTPTNTSTPTQTPTNTSTPTQTPTNTSTPTQTPTPSPTKPTAVSSYNSSSVISTVGGTAVTTPNSNMNITGSNYAPWSIEFNRREIVSSPTTINVRIYRTGFTTPHYVLQPNVDYVTNGDPFTLKTGHGDYNLHFNDGTAISTYRRIDIA